MGIVNTGLLSKDVRSEFLNRFDGSPTFWQRVATRIASTKDSESYKWLGTVPQVREWGSGRVAKGLRTESYDVENLKYEATLEVDRDELDDDQTGQIMIRIGELAQRTAEHKDVLIENLLTNGGAAGFLSYDGQVFFSAAHVSGASGTQDNTTTSLVVDNDVDKPTVEEFKAAVRTMIARMGSFKDDQGEPMRVRSSGLVLAVNPALEFIAREAMNAGIIANTTNVMQGVADVLPMPGLTTAGVFHLLKTDGVVKPFVFQDRAPVEIKSLTENTTEEFMREKYYFGVRARYRMTYGYWQYAIKHTFTT